MSQWFATSKNFKKQKKIFTTLVKNQSFDASIKKLSQDINSIIQSTIFMDLFFTEILWIGSQARIDPSKNGPIASLFIKESLQLCDDFESSGYHFAEDYRVRLNTNIAITIELLKELETIQDGLNGAKYAISNTLSSSIKQSTVVPVASGSATKKKRKRKYKKGPSKKNLSKKNSVI